MHSSPLPMPWPPIDVALAADLGAADPLCIIDEATSAAKAGVDWLHVDVMYGHPTPRLGLPPNIPKALVTRQPLPICAHVLGEHPLDAALTLADGGVSLIIIGAESTRQPRALAEQIRAVAGARVGLSLEPSTPLAWLDGVIDTVDLVLLLATEPSHAQQPFVPHTFDKMTALCRLAQRRAPKCVLGVKGDITPPRAKALAEAGAQLFVLGRYMFGQAERRAPVALLRHQAQQGLQSWQSPTPATNF